MAAAVAEAAAGGYLSSPCPCPCGGVVALVVQVADDEQGAPGATQDAMRS